MVEPLLVEALKAGITVAEFWDLTPRETWQVLEAAAWRAGVEHRGRLWLAWHVAAFTRAKRMPPLGKLIKPPPAKKLEGAELDKRKAEFEEMKARWQAKAS